jgi:hypothetical protein
MRTLAALFVVAVAIYLQQPSPKPSFAGTWVLESSTAASSDNPTALTVRESVQRKTLRGEPLPTAYLSDLTVERHYTSRVVSEDYRVGSVEGRVEGGPAMPTSAPARAQQADTRFSVAWDGNSLVFSNGKYSGPSTSSGPYSEHREVWSIDAQQKLHVALTDSGSDRPTSMRTLTYRRR